MTLHSDDEVSKAIWSAVVDECTGRIGRNEPHATTWARGGYRNDVPTLCDRCERLITTLQSLHTEAAIATIDRIDSALRGDGRSAMLIVTAQEIINQYREGQDRHE